MIPFPELQVKPMIKIRYRNFQPSRVNDPVQGTIRWVAEVFCPVHGEIAIEDVDIRQIYPCEYDWQRPCCRKCNETLPGLPEDMAEREIYEEMMNLEPKV